MGQSFVVSLRGFVLLAFLVVMPLLAAPAVGKWYDAWLLGELKSTSSVKKCEPADREENAPTVLVNRTSEDVSPSRVDYLSEADIPPAPFAPSPGPGIATEKSGERFEAIPQRLKQLGAEYLKLESVAGSELQYRFRCTVPLPGSEAYGRQFEVTASDPVEAMQQVLAQVEAWQAARDNSHEIRAAAKRR